MLSLNNASHHPLERDSSVVLVPRGEIGFTREGRTVAPQAPLYPYPPCQPRKGTGCPRPALGGGACPRRNFPEVVGGGESSPFPPTSLNLLESSTLVF